MTTLRARCHGCQAIRPLAELIPVQPTPRRRRYLCPDCLPPTRQPEERSAAVTAQHEEEVT